MTNATKAKLNRLAKIADIKADQAVSALARSSAEKRRLADALKALDREIGEVLADAFQPADQYLAIEYAAMMRVRRQEILIALARIERTRISDFKVAQTEEGRRIALARLITHAS